MQNVRADNIERGRDAHKRQPQEQTSSYEDLANTQVDPQVDFTSPTVQRGKRESQWRTPARQMMKGSGSPSQRAVSLVCTN